MGDTRDVSRQLDNWQKVIEYSLAVIVPTALAAMMFSFISAPELLTRSMLAAIGAAALTIIPALMVQKLHYQCWAKNTMPHRIITSLISMIYISTVAVFSVSLLSLHHGLDPGQPLTFAVIVALLLCLITVMAYSSKNKARFERMDIRYFRRPVSDIDSTIRSVLDEEGESIREERQGRRARLVVESKKIVITIASQPRRSTEVVIECAELSGRETCELIKRRLGEN